MGRNDVEAFLTYLAVEKHVAASTQNQALSAILFLYCYVLKIELTDIFPVSKIPQRRSSCLIQFECRSRSFFNIESIRL